jgi:hypothetical protein
MELEGGMRGELVARAIDSPADREMELEGDMRGELHGAFLAGEWFAGGQSNRLTCRWRDGAGGRYERGTGGQSNRLTCRWRDGAGGRYERGTSWSTPHR